MRKLTKKGEVLVLKVVGPNGESHGGFVWPLTVGAVVEAPDWNPAASCGNGLHGWHYGAGDPLVAGNLAEAGDTRWLLLAVPEDTLIDLDGKVKFPRCRIAFSAAESGPAGRTACVSLLIKYAPRDKAVMWGSAAAGYAGSAAAGYAGSAAAGYAGSAAAGIRGSAAAGIRGSAAAGEYGSAAAGIRGSAAAGEYGSAAAGYAGSAAVEADGLATSSVGGIVRGGANAVLVALYSTGSHRSDFDYSVGQVGKNGIEADVWYEGSASGLKKVADSDGRVRTFNERWERLQAQKAAHEKAVAEANEKADAAEKAAAKLEQELRAKIAPPTPPKKAGV